MLERKLHSDAAFVTLTYNDGHKPLCGNLVPRQLPVFVRALRDRLRGSISLRYFAVGEYGGENTRPHYHLALYGYPSCSSGNTQFERDGETPKCCTQCQELHYVWKKGRVESKYLGEPQALYLAGYVVKGWTADGAPGLGSREPEFALMSRKPGLGHDWAHESASTHLRYDLSAQSGDVVSALRHGSRILPLGKYLTRKLRKYTGQDEKAPQATITKMEATMLPLREAAKNDPENPSVKSQVLKSNQARYEREIHLRKLGLRGKKGDPK